MNRPAPSFQPMSLDDFEELLADAPDDERWELISGRVVRMMVGARWEHNQIITNLNVALVNRFRAGKAPCRTLVESFRMRKAEARSSLLPDLIVYCRPLAPGATSLDDPTVVFEVLSDGTQRRDREDKWAVYQTLPSLKHYVLVTRDRAHVETIDRIDGEWRGHRIADGLDATLILDALDLSIPLQEIYADVFA
jgi:Uma2 family endonuclease